MAKSKKKVGKRYPKADATCAYPGCAATVDEDNYCHGCENHVCEEHATNPEAGGFGHDVEEHWLEPSDW